MGMHKHAYNQTGPVNLAQLQFVIAKQVGCPQIGGGEQHVALWGIVYLQACTRTE
jgi:hypothetical protein